jgi:exosortase
MFAPMNAEQASKKKTDWREDAVACWQRLPNKFFFFTLLAAWLLAFHFWGNSTLGYTNSPSLFRWLQSAYASPAPGATNDDAIGQLIPLLVIGLFWLKRKTLLALPLQLWWPGLFIMVVAALLHATGFVLQQSRVSVAAMILGVYGLMGLAWGRAWLKEGFFPFWLFIFSVPLAALLLPLTFPLRMLATWLTATVADVLTIPVVRVGTQLMSPDGKFQYDVVAACSGMRSLIAIFLLTTVYGFVVFRSPGKRIFLMALALPLSVLGNFTRLMCIVIAAEMGGQSAGNFVHENSFFSLVPYVPAIAGLLWAGRWLEKKEEVKRLETQESAEAKTP